MVTLVIGHSFVSLSSLMMMMLRVAVCPGGRASLTNGRHLSGKACHLGSMLPSGCPGSSSSTNFPFVLHSTFKWLSYVS